eukprot:Hpha_TRINITY_DN3097_c0_g1::TRINITY_DN3097_c0_g1_i1::g.138759::m.138759
MLRESLPSNGVDWSGLVGTNGFHSCLPGVAQMIADQVALTNLQPRSCVRTNFDGKETVNVGRYLHRLCAHGGASAQVYAAMIVYVQRLTTQGVHFTSRSVLRLLAALYVVASRFIDDVSYGTEFYAALTLVPRTELNVMVGQVLSALNWELVISPGEFAQALEVSLLVAVDGNQSLLPHTGTGNELHLR